MKVLTKLKPEHIGKFTVLNAGGGKSFAVLIKAIKGDLVFWDVLDKDMPLRSGTTRFKETDDVYIYDTPKEALNWGME